MKNNDFKVLIENYILDYFNSKPSEIKEYLKPMVYSLTIGGKRIRPILLLLTYSLYKEDTSEALPFATAMEMIHTYSLIHDDLPSMDNDDLRRGKPTNHKVFGEARAVLAGDALLNEAMILMFNECMNAEMRKIEASNIIAKSAGAEGMILGQIIDIESEGKSISEEMLLMMHKNKTGKLIKASILAGATLGEASSDELKILEKYGENLGLAFQIKDDILDYTGDEKIAGKSLSDKDNLKTNFITMYGMDECKKQCIKLTNECIELLNSLKGDTTELKELTEFLLVRNY
ncbi:polyprenyl synthetase family protein [Clostridium ihumii]|uniref:polyprenyl synthetase family protein n=1 Tax=Clostridium ihumii TaxID=1470356 RepID=UPI00058EA35B|nr:farnesyl diphosphate synthase [Clostridium ihumii]